MAKILLAGDGWGAIAAFNSLKVSEEHQLFIFTHDENWKNQLQEENYFCVNSFNGTYDLVITAGWRPIIKEDVLKKFRILNIHYSLLPAYRGFHGTVWAILNNESKLGITIHRMNAHIDDGPIVYQFSLDNNFVDTATSYMSRFNDNVQEQLLTVVNEYLSGERNEVPQDKSKASWVGKRKPGHCALDFTKTLDYQKAFFRALSQPYPAPYFIVKGQIFEVHKATFHESPVSSDNGRILNIDNEGVWISCVGGYIVCKKIILQSGGKEVPYKYFKIGQMTQVPSQQQLQLVGQLVA